MPIEPEPSAVAMPCSEQRLIDEVLARSPGDEFGDELELALARLRNLREKYTERAKRARLEARAGVVGESPETLRAWLHRIEAAARHARWCLGQGPDPADAAALVDAD